MSANFPTGLDSYTTKIDNVDDVLASHLNDVQDAIAVLEAKVGVNSSSVITSLDYFLKHASGAYRTHIHDGTSDDGAKIPFASVSDISLSSLTNQQYLRYNSSSGKWENYSLTLALSGLSDCTIASPALREGLYYDTGDSKWKNGYANATYAS